MRCLASSKTLRRVVVNSLEDCRFGVASSAETSRTEVSPTRCDSWTGHASLLGLGRDEFRVGNAQRSVRASAGWPAWQGGRGLGRWQARMLLCCVCRCEEKGRVGRCGPPSAEQRGDTVFEFLQEVVVSRIPRLLCRGRGPARLQTEGRPSATRDQNETSERDMMPTPTPMRVQWCWLHLAGATTGLSLPPSSWHRG